MVPLYVVYVNTQHKHLRSLHFLPCRNTHAAYVTTCVQCVFHICYIFKEE